MNDHVMKLSPTTSVMGYPAILASKLRPLDPRRLDFRSHAHTHFTMVKEGVYPLDMPPSEIEKAVRGTFGGRFEYCRDGKFRYIAHTD